MGEVGYTCSVNGLPKGQPSQFTRMEDCEEVQRQAINAEPDSTKQKKITIRVSTPVTDLNFASVDGTSNRGLYYTGPAAVIGNITKAEQVPTSKFRGTLELLKSLEEMLDTNHITLIVGKDKNGDPIGLSSGNGEVTLAQLKAIDWIDDKGEITDKGRFVIQLAALMKRMKADDPSAAFDNQKIEFAAIYDEYKKMKLPLGATPTEKMLYDVWMGVVSNEGTKDDAQLEKLNKSKTYYTKHYSYSSTDLIENSHQISFELVGKSSDPLDSDKKKVAKQLGSLQRVRCEKPTTVSFYGFPERTKLIDEAAIGQLVKIMNGLKTDLGDEQKHQGIKKMSLLVDGSNQLSFADAPSLKTIKIGGVTIKCGVIDGGVVIGVNQQDLLALSKEVDILSGAVLLADKNPNVDIVFTTKPDSDHTALFYRWKIGGREVLVVNTGNSENRDPEKIAGINFSNAPFSFTNTATYARGKDKDGKAEWKITRAWPSNGITEEGYEMVISSEVTSIMNERGEEMNKKTSDELVTAASNGSGAEAVKKTYMIPQVPSSPDDPSAPLVDDKSTVLLASTPPSGAIYKMTITYTLVSGDKISQTIDVPTSEAKRKENPSSVPEKKNKPVEQEAEDQFK